MLADVHANLGGCPRRSRRAARPRSWRRRRDRTPRFRAAHQTRSTTSEGLCGCPRDAGCTFDIIFPGAVRRARSYPAPYDAGRFARPETICEMVGGCTYRDRLALVVHDRPGDRALLRKAATSGELAAGLRLSPRRRAASWGRGGDPAGALFMDVRPPKNSPRTSNVSTCRVRLSVMLFIVFCGVRFERGVGRRQSYFPPLGTMMARRADDPIPIERRPRAARRP